jgi:outer membrane protein assembly factor BamB
MAIVKLVCQGCGANLDAFDNQSVMQCGYCGTVNQIKKAVHEPPAKKPPPPVQQPAPQLQPPPAVQVHVSPQAPRPQHSSGGGLRAFLLIMALLPLIAGGAITFFAAQGTHEMFKGVEAVPGFRGAGGGTGAAKARSYSWRSERPFVADVNGDGVDDILGTIYEFDSQNLLLTAMSGSDWATLWETTIGKQSDISGRLLVRFEPQHQLLLLALGASLTAYDAKTGEPRWVTNLSDAVENIAIEGEQLWVATIDEGRHVVALADGSSKPAKAKAEPGADTKLLPDDRGYELIPTLGTLDLKHDQFMDLRVQVGYCPQDDLPLFLERRRNRNLACGHARGLAFATRAQGTAVPFFVGYDQKTKAERWRVQLTTPGTLETVDTGFGQPRAELLGNEAIVSFVPKDNDARIRRISLVDGVTKWETKLSRTSTQNVDSIVVGKDRVFVNYGGGVHVLSLVDGQAQAILGR